MKTATAKRRLHGGTVDPISARHRRYGIACPALDVDLVLVEYRGSNPKALIEYKRSLSRDLPIDESRSIRVLANLATAAKIPALVVSYDPDLWRFRVKLANDVRATALLARAGDTSPILSEREFVEFLYALRGTPAPKEVLASCR